MHRKSNTAAPVYAAIDLGTSNCRMLIAKPSGRGFQVAGSFSRIVRLGEGLSASGRLGDAAIGRTIDALKECAEKLKEKKVCRIRSVATEACRRADNSDEFTRRVKAQTGLELETISARKESQLTLNGCVPLLDTGLPFALIIDIGGGSTEFMWIELKDGRSPRLAGLKSLPLGVLELAERFGSDAVSYENYKNMMELADAALSDFDAKHAISREVAKGGVQILGTSGTVTMLGGLYLDLPRYNRAKVDGLDMDTKSILKIAARIAGMDRAKRAAIPCIGHQRAELAVGGCAFLEAVIRRWPVKRLRAADRGIREGLLFSMMAEDGVLNHDH